MQRVSTAHSEALIHTVFRALQEAAPVVLNGPRGSGKTYALRTLSAVLTKRDIPNQYVNATGRDAVAKLTELPPDAILLFDDYPRAPFEVLRTAAKRLSAGTRVIGAAAELALESEYDDRFESLYTAEPSLQNQLQRTQTIRLEPHSADEIARLVHQRSTAPIDSAAQATIQQLAWGRPGWALDLLQLHHSGSLSRSPLPRITRVRAEDLSLPSLQGAVGIATEHLDADDIAEATVLSEIGPRSWGGIADVIGDDRASRLAQAGFLLEVPGSGGLHGVPELYAAATQRFTSAEKLVAARRSAAELLLGQEILGIPLPDQEAIFCGRVMSGRDRHAAADTIPVAPHSQFAQRVIDDLVAFGKGTQARDMLLRFGANGPELSPLERARLATVLRSAHAGLQAIMASESLSDEDADTRFALMLLRGRLAAETGIPFENDLDICDDDRTWCDAMLVVRRWNDTCPLGADAHELMRIAGAHPMPQVSLLAEHLLSFEAACFGLRYRAFTGDTAEQRIARLAVRCTDASRDALESIAVAHSITKIFSAAPIGDEQRGHIVDRLQGSSRHRVWASHLQAAHTAMMGGDPIRTHQEWLKFAGTVPRFLPWRLQSTITMSGRLPEDASAASGIGQIGVLAEYCTGRIDDSVAAGLGDPLGSYARHNSTRFDSAELGEAPDRPAIRKHIEAVQMQNPLALARAGDELVQHGLWAPAMNAYREARRIYLRRRATGSVTSTDERIQSLEAEISARVPWFDSATLHAERRERLTPREETAARFAAAGLSNRRIAEQMDCSIRTVESHIAQARAKLGFTNRNELKAHFAEE